MCSEPDSLEVSHPCYYQCEAISNMTPKPFLLKKTCLIQLLGHVLAKIRHTWAIMLFFKGMCVNSCLPKHVSPVCIRTKQRGEQSRGWIQIPPLTPGPLAAGLLALCRLLCESLTERLESFLFRLQEMPLPERFLVNHFSSFYFTFYLPWFSEPSKGWRKEGNRRRRDKRWDGLILVVYENRFPGSASVFHLLLESVNHGVSFVYCVLVDCDDW